MHNIFCTALVCLPFASVVSLLGKQHVSCSRPGTFSQRNMLEVRTRVQTCQHVIMVVTITCWEGFEHWQVLSTCYYSNYWITAYFQLINLVNIIFFFLLLCWQDLDTDKPCQHYTVFIVSIWTSTNLIRIMRVKTI